MAVKLRLTRVGSKKNPIYRVVAADSRSPRDGKFIEILGRYNPQHEPSLIEFDEAARQLREQLSHRRYFEMPLIFSSFETVALGCAPFESHFRAFSSSTSMRDGSCCGL